MYSFGLFRKQKMWEDNISKYASFSHICNQNKSQTKLLSLLKEKQKVHEKKRDWETLRVDLKLKENIKMRNNQVKIKTKLQKNTKKSRIDTFIQELFFMAG